MHHLEDLLLALQRGLDCRYTDKTGVEADAAATAASCSFQARQTRPHAFQRWERRMCQAGHSSHPTAAIHAGIKQVERNQSATTAPESKRSTEARTVLVLEGLLEVVQNPLQLLGHLSDLLAHNTACKIATRMIAENHNAHIHECSAKAAQHPGWTMGTSLSAIGHEAPAQHTRQPRKPERRTNLEVHDDLAHLALQPACAIATRTRQNKPIAKEVALLKSSWPTKRSTMLEQNTGSRKANPHKRTHDVS